MTWRIKLQRGAFVMAFVAAVALASGASWIEGIIGWLW